VELPVPLAALPALDTGSVLSVTGVCQVDPGPQRRFARLYLPESARLLLRSVADIRVIRPAPWWNERRLATALASVGAGLLLIAGWTWSLRSRNAQLRNQMEARRRAETEVQRRRDEQSLLAADLHDSLEQTLTGVALQLQAARDQLPPNSNAPQEHLTLAERLLEHGRTGVHRAVRDLRLSSQEALDLQDELRELIRTVSAQRKVKVDLSLPESLPELPVQTRCHLLHFAQEAVTNALKHANGEQVLLQLRIEEGRASLMVSDDGRGFDPMECPGPSQGHFGLQGMRERAARMNGTLHLETKPGSGTRLTLSIPILS
jgi:signal transduction histidine kinase